MFRPDIFQKNIALVTGGGSGIGFAISSNIVRRVAPVLIEKGKYDYPYLGVTSRERSPALPEVPTLIESGLKDFEVVGFYGLLAPAGTPPETLARVAQALQQTLDSPEVRSRMLQQGAEPAFLGPEAFGRFLRAELPRWERAVKASGARLD